MDHQPTNHRDVAGTIDINSANWVKLISLQRILWPNNSKRQVVLDLIDERHEQMIQDMGNLLEGKNND